MHVHNIVASACQAWVTAVSRFAFSWQFLSASKSQGNGLTAPQDVCRALGMDYPFHGRLQTIGCGHLPAAQLICVSVERPT